MTCYVPKNSLFLYCNYCRPHPGPFLNYEREKKLVEYVADRSGLNKGDIQMAPSELSAAVQFYNKQGQGVITILNLTQRRQERKELKINKNSVMLAVRLSESASGTTLREKY